MSGNPLQIETDSQFQYLLRIDPQFASWQTLAAQWYAMNPDTWTQNALNRFFLRYIHPLAPDRDPRALFASGGAWPQIQDHAMSGLKGRTAKNCQVCLHEFLDWVLREEFAIADIHGNLRTPPDLANPLPRGRKRMLKKRLDLAFNYVLGLDNRMEPWRALASEWFAEQRSDEDRARESLDFFLQHSVLHGGHFDPPTFFSPDVKVTPLFQRFMDRRADRDAPYNPGLSTYDHRRYVYIRRFLDWVLTSKLSTTDNAGQTLIPAGYANPFPQIEAPAAERDETPKIPLARCHIRELKSILVEGPTFRDWKWAQQFGVDWFEVDPSLVDETDPDCVWRRRRKSVKTAAGKKESVEVVELWSPVRAVAQYCKLELPLRDFQVRFLDSGEADTFRYVSGDFVANKSPMRSGTEARPITKGVFRQAQKGGSVIYINTNKSADVGKDPDKKGYVIKWKHKALLGWLEKLRNWQERYNPIESPTLWMELEEKHFRHYPGHPDKLHGRKNCFLFRAASARGDDRRKPMCQETFSGFWYLLLKELENRFARREEKAADGSPICFVVPDSKATFFPPHALRVSHISAYILEGSVPIEIVSSMFAGHRRITMTLYYLKAGREYMTHVMQEAERQMMARDGLSYKRFAMESGYRKLEQTFAFVSRDGMNACANQESSAGIVFDDRGMCPVGARLCHIGGPLLDDTVRHITAHAPVPGFPQERNCARCRFFMSGPAFLPGLVAHFNQRSYEASECAGRYRELEQRLFGIEERRSACQQLDQPFVEAEDYHRLSQRVEEQADRVKRVFDDMHASFSLIEQSIEIANSRRADHDGPAIISLGGMSDLKASFYEASELHQLEVICENAVIYPGADATKATLRRSQILDAMLELNDTPPVLFRLSPEQQLQAGNEIMKLIQARTGNLPGAVEIAEGKRMLQDFGILEKTTDLIDHQFAAFGLDEIMQAVRQERKASRMVSREV
ncbi:conserved hypothetical protein [Paraburkholderia sabiae]|uniref:gamma-mobile-trio integrase GmtZ n=1 Tax=Paraburkholderia sabiae TaxID=273251 RepID=UPI001CB2D996|nr:VPA1269 family protein [Paraburkholderia sabiae]CAG9228572.1 conserved hypothetical protein [Paraburkholderia sabiae]